MRPSATLLANELLEAEVAREQEGGAAYLVDDEGEVIGVTVIVLRRRVSSVGTAIVEERRPNLAGLAFRIADTMAHYIAELLASGGGPCNRADCDVCKGGNPCH